MDLEQKINKLQSLVSKYDTESFAGFFAYFIKHHPDPAASISINKFGSKLKDFLYLISLNVFSEERGNKKLEFSNREIEIFANILNDIKGYDNPVNINEHTPKSVIHEMAIRNHFDNGVLSYVEQDLEKIRRIFTPFENEIVNEFGLDINFLIGICKEIELISKIRAKKQMSFKHSKEFIDFNEKVQVKKMNFSDAFALLPENTQEDFYSFSFKNYAHLIFKAEDLYQRLDKQKVDIFLSLFSCTPVPNTNIRYYTAENPFESTPLLKFSDGIYLSLYGKQIPISIYKFLYANLIESPRYNSKLRKHREKSLEYKVVELFKYLFPIKDALFYENYYVINNFEQDLLIIYKGTAIIVEIKASKLREPFRDPNKAYLRLKEDFKNAVQYGFDQCKRIEDYFYDNEEFNITDGKKRFCILSNQRKFILFIRLL